MKGLFPMCAMMMAATLAVSCQDSLKDSEQYKVPDWLKGSAWQVLESEGNHTMFLEAVDSAGYRPVVDGKSILTVMAPDDDAFKSFLSEQGYQSVAEMSRQNPALLKNTIGLHLMYYAYNWDKLLNFRPNEGDGATEEQKAEEAGMYYKHRTRSSDPIEQARVRMTAQSAQDTLLSIYHYERFLPVLSARMFETKGIDAAYNYEYFFRGSQWTGGAAGFNVANASVKDTKEVVTDNGYLYHINQVIRPLETIYTELRRNAEYSDFLSLYDQYSTYEPADQETNTNLGYIAYVHRHNGVPSIACEWPVTDYRLMATLSRTGYSIFAPTNAAIDQFFRSYWTADGGYQELADLDPLIIQYFILQSFAAASEPVFPEEIKNGKVTTAYGTPINIDPDQVTDRRVCVNGMLYGMDHMKAPAIFSSVVGPAFKDTTYINYLYALDGSEMMLSLASNKSEFVTLIPANSQFAKSDPPMRLYTTTQGRELQEYSAQEGNYVKMGRGRMLDIVNIHTATNVSQLRSSGIQVVPTNTSFNYWYVRDGKITTNALFNQQLQPDYAGDPFVPFHEIQLDGGTWDNGRAYSYDADALFTAASGDDMAHLLAIGNDRHYEYYLFSQLLQKAGIATGGGLTVSGADIRNIVFVPTNEAIRQNISKIPGCSALTIDEQLNVKGTVSGASKTLLANYLRRYFVSSLMNTFQNYPYPGSGFSGGFLTMSGETLSIQSTEAAVSISLEQTDQPKTISVSQKYDCLPFVFSDGCMQFIDDIIE